MNGPRRPLLLACLTLLAGDACAPPEPARPNVVLIVSDDQDYEHFGFAGHGGALTPAIDELAREGFTFPVAWTAPRCRPALAGLLSGREPRHTGIYYGTGPDTLRGVPLLPALLRDAGYATYVEGKFWEGDPSEVGFTHESGGITTGMGLNLGGFVRSGQASLFEFLEGVGDRPFFVWWAPMLPHVPHNPPGRLRSRFRPESVDVPDWIDSSAAPDFQQLEAKSLAMVAWFDEGVGALRVKLRELDLERNTLFVFLVDNGWANGHVSKGSPYEKGVRTPVILSWPGHIQSGSNGEHLASYLDVFPTLLDYVGLAAPTELDGASLRPFAEGGGEPRSVLLGACYPELARDDAGPEGDLLALSARDARWKYVRWTRDIKEERNEKRLRIKHIGLPFPTRAAGTEELYDLAEDPYEQRDLSGDPAHAVELARLRAEVDRWWSGL